jgi:glycosyltransferase involved in cell wall biosynthesis
MKLIVMIPCLNEELTLAQVVQTIPTRIPGIDCIETLVVDDSSTDDTVGVASRLGVNHIVRLKHHMGLARAFQHGLDACLDLGADIIVNTDGDNQYPSEYIPQLVQPIVSGEGDIVIGDRQTHMIDEFSATKKLLQRFGSWMVRKLSGATEVRDAVSGFRAYSRYAASRICLNNSYSYTIESLIHASKRGLRIISVPITSNPNTRPSRLMKNIRSFVARSGAILVKSYLLYEPLKVFGLLGALSFAVGSILGIFVIYYQMAGPLSDHILTAILSVTLLAAGVFLPIIGLLAEHIGANRKLLEELVWREKLGNRRLLNALMDTDPHNQYSDFEITESLTGQLLEQDDPVTALRRKNGGSRLTAVNGHSK